ncbi:hypothetical protein vB_Pae_PS44_00005 [Pseudomonas phage vB_Pae_PS44]|uniref:Uncharacterized protein n=1 Tax=Pseudomonas phage vB_Pae_PS44 TaxID=1542090 RepID=A0A0K0L8V4_9CAUD|nr:hypothetical protein AVT16_gp05 [Pseudomonas phage vB_Pae_PS44]AIW01559.1 hypothetical protein vB_Pae_PS44_00005 [Pseudomonas phage vB_Pae_PS44]
MIERHVVDAEVVERIRSLRMRFNVLDETLQRAVDMAMLSHQKSLQDLRNYEAQLWDALNARYGLSVEKTYDLQFEGEEAVLVEVPPGDGQGDDFAVESEAEALATGQEALGVGEAVASTLSARNRTE